MPFARSAKLDARGACNVGLLQQRIGHLHAVQGRVREAGEQVKRAFDGRAGDAWNLRQRVQHEAPARGIGSHHLLDAVLRSVERGNACGHAKRGRGGDAVRLQFHRQLDDRLRRGQPAQAPTGHGIRLAEAVDRDCALGHAWLGGQGIVHRAIEQEIFIDLIADDVEIGCVRDLDDRIHLAARQHAAGGVARAVDHDGFGLGRQVLAQNLFCHQEVFIAGQADVHGDRAIQAHDRVVADPGRFQDHDLIAGIDQRGDGEVERPFAAGGDDDLAGADLDAVFTFQLRGDSLQQFGLALRGWVVGVAGVHGLDRGVNDVLRRLEVRVAAGQGNDIAALRLERARFVGNGDRGRRGNAAQQVRQVIHVFLRYS